MPIEHVYVARVIDGLILVIGFFLNSEFSSHLGNSGRVDGARSRG